MVDIYTDGGCSPNPGKGAWAAIILYNGEPHRLSDVEAQTTNNRMEMLAVIEALKYIGGAAHELTVYTDSMYVVNAINNQISWLKKKNLPNQDLVFELYELWNEYDASIKWVRGHNKNKWNEECDQCIKKLLS